MIYKRSSNKIKDMSVTLTRLKDGTKYAGNETLSDVDYFNIGSIKKGSKICITGPPCVGKTSLAKYLMKKRNIRKWTFCGSETISISDLDRIPILCVVCDNILEPTPLTDRLFCRESFDVILIGSSSLLKSYVYDYIFFGKGSLNLDEAFTSSNNAFMIKLIRELRPNQFLIYIRNGIKLGKIRESEIPVILS